MSIKPKPQQDTLLKSSQSQTNPVVYYNNTNLFPDRRPKYLKLLNEIITAHFEPILNYLDLIDLSSLKCVNKALCSIINEYYQTRLKLEINYITNYQEENREKTSVFMKNIDCQIPVSNNNWLDFNLQSVTMKLQLLDRNILTKIRAIRSIGKLNDVIFAPFCLIFEKNEMNNPNNNNSNNGEITWKKRANKILSDPGLILKITNLDLENLEDKTMLETFAFLNLPELSVPLIKKYSSDFAKLITWCQAVVSYHILIHPYTYRNDKSVIPYGSDVYEFACEMNRKINRFYKFKRFLYDRNILRIPLADYVFNLQHTLKRQQKEESIVNNLTEMDIAKILSYLPYKNSYPFMNVSKKFYYGFKASIDYDVLEILKEVYFFKFLGHEKMAQKIPLMYSKNIFSNYFLMLDDILHSQSNELGMSFIPFLTKEQANNIRKLKIPSDIINSVAKVFCLICDKKPPKKNINVLNNNNNNTNQLSPYVEMLKTLATNGSLQKLMRNTNKLLISENNRKELYKEISKYANVQLLEEVKNVNRGIYQLLIWELFVLEYLQTYNPFDFIHKQYIINRYEQEELEMIQYYMEIMDYLKYHLKIKYYFSSNSESPSPVFGLAQLSSELKNYLTEKNLDTNNEHQFTSSNPKLEHIASTYFESRSLIPIGAKPTLYEKIITEILKAKQDEDINKEYESLIKHSIENKFDYSLHIRDEIEDDENNNNNTNNMNTKVLYSKSKNKCFLDRMMYDNNNTNYIVTPCQKNKLLNFNILPDSVIIKNILFYLDIKSIPTFSLINKKACKCLKTHMFIRIYFLNIERKLIENNNMNLIKQIESKRKKLYADFEMIIPTKEHSYLLMNQITCDDIMEIKQCFKKYHKTYETLITPLLVLFNEKPKTILKQDGKKENSYYETAKKVLYKPGFIKRLKELELETIPGNVYRNVEKALKDPLFSSNKLKVLSPCLCHLYSWISGVVEFHRAVRKYCLNSYDYEILNCDEQKFCSKMDNVALMYFKILRYANKYCSQYESEAKEYMKDIFGGKNGNKEDNKKIEEKK